MSKNEYTPYGPLWGLEMKKMSKGYLIELLRKAYQEIGSFKQPESFANIDPEHPLPTILILSKKQTAVLYDLGPSKGKVELYNEEEMTHSYSWGAMGGTISEFISGINESYFASNLRKGSGQKFSVKKTFQNIRKHLKDEMGFTWFKYKDFHSHVMEKIRMSQILCEEYDTEEFFVDEIYYTIHHHGIDYYLCDERGIEEEFKSNFSEPWHFLSHDSSDEYNMLIKAFHKIQKKLITKIPSE